MDRLEGTPRTRRGRRLGMTRELIMTELRGGLWHTTHPDRFENILGSGGIFPEPNIPETGRWKPVGGKDHYPYARILGGVSLFDFDQFDPDRYSEKYPLSSWCEFVPYRKLWGRAVWIEIDRELAAPHLVSSSELVAKWKSDEAYGHNFMPYIEAAYLGVLPRRAFKRAFLVCGDDDIFHLLAV